MTISTPSPTLDKQSSSAFDFSKIGDQKEHDKLVAWALDNYTTIKNARQRIEWQWYQNLAFYYGNQNIVPQRVGDQVKFAVPSAPYWRARPVINKIRPMVRTELAKVTAQKPSASIIPASSEDKDLFAAQAGEQIWESIYQRKKFKQVLRRAMFWTLICGNGYIKEWYDQDTVDPDSKQPGDILISSETPFHVYVPDFREEDIENQPYLIHATTKSVDWVKTHYKKSISGKDITANTKSSQEVIDNGFVNLISAKDNIKDSVLCLEVWVKPGTMQKFPNGCTYTVVGDQIVTGMEGWPYEHGDFPFTKFDHIPTGRYYNESNVTDIIPLQKEYNRTIGQIIEAKNRMAKPQLLYFLGSLDPAKITSEPGLAIGVRPGYAMPQPLPLIDLPSYVLNVVDRIQGDMDDISGQHEVSKGQTPQGVTAATAISYLQEQDDTKLSHTIDSVESGVEKIAGHALSYVRQFWDIPRMVKITGTDGAFDTMMFQAADLGNNTDIRVEAGSALPTSKAAKQAYIMDLMKMGFIKPEQGLEIMEIGGIQRLYDKIQVDVRQAQRENLKMQAVDDQIMQQHFQQHAPVDPNTGGPMLVDPATGQPPVVPPVVPVNTWDEHAMHIETHNKFRKSQAFDMLPDHTKAVFEEHVQMHAAALSSVSMGTPGIGGANAPGTDPQQGNSQQQGSPPPPGGSDPNAPQDDTAPPSGG